MYPVPWLSSALGQLYAHELLQGIIAEAEEFRGVNHEGNI
jgi:hypothetical protein